MEVKKVLSKAVLFVALTPYLINLAYAGTQYVGQAIQPVSQSGTWTSSVSGSTITIAAGSASIGNVGLNAGANTIGNVGIVGTVPLPTGAATEATLQGIETGTDRIPAQGQATKAASLPVTMASDQGAIPTSVQTSSAPVNISVTATTTSGQLVNANPNRKGIECESSCTGNKRVFMRFGTSAATSADKPLEPCSSWEPPATVVPTSAIQIVSESGTQAVLCVEY